MNSNHNRIITTLREGAIFVFFIIVAILATYPLVFQLTTGFPGVESDHDVAAFIWNIWWVKYAVIERHTNPFFSDHIFTPFVMDLRLHTFAPLLGFVSIPFQYFLGVVGAFNAMIIGTIALNGYMVYRLAKLFILNWIIAVTVGILVAISPPVMFHMSVGRPSFSSVWIVAAALVSLYQLVNTRKQRYSFALGFSLVAALFLDFQMVLYTVMWLAIFGIYLIFTEKKKLLNPKLWIQLFVSVLIFLIPFGLIFFDPLMHAEANGYPIPTDKATLVYSFRWVDYFTPFVIQFIMGMPLALIFVIAFLPGFRNPDARVWIFGTILFIVLSLGVVLKPTEIPLPFQYLRKLPGMQQFRTPYRFNMPGVIGIGMAIGITWQSIQARLKNWNFGLALIVSIISLYNLKQVYPFHVQNYPNEPIYHQIAALDGDFTVLEVPMGIRSGIQQFGTGETLQYYQVIHGKKVINGMVARVPKNVFQYFRKSPVLKIFAGEAVHTPNNELDEKFIQLIEELDIRYIIIHPTMLESNAHIQVEDLIDRHPNFVMGENNDFIQIYEYQIP